MTYLVDVGPGMLSNSPAPCRARRDSLSLLRQPSLWIKKAGVLILPQHQLVLNRHEILADAAAIRQRASARAHETSSDYPSKPVALWLLGRAPSASRDSLWIGGISSWKGCGLEVVFPVASRTDRGWEVLAEF